MNSFLFCFCIATHDTRPRRRACRVSFGISPWPWELRRRASPAARIAYSSLFLLGDVKKKKNKNKRKKETHFYYFL